MKCKNLDTGTTDLKFQIIGKIPEKLCGLGK